MTSDWSEVVAAVEDLLAPKLQLDVYERTLYYHMLRHTRLLGKECAAFGLAALASTTAMSEYKVREAVRSMDRKGCIRIEHRTRKGHVVRVLLPSEMTTLRVAEDKESVTDVERLDFFTGRKYLPALLARENDRCFYCLRSIAPDSSALDHANPQMNGLDNSYRNIVAACHECNLLKQGRSAPDFIRLLYRKGVLSAAECQDRIEALAALAAGKLVPEL